MAAAKVYPYEAMFLVSQASAADLAGVISHINELLARAKASIVAMRKWDERRLAYEIRKQKRGLYIHTYFMAPGSAIAGLERDCKLSEQILRSLIIRVDHLTEDEMKAADAREALETEAKLRAKQAASREAEPVAAAAAAEPAPEPAVEA